MLEFIVDDNTVLRKYDAKPERYKIPMYSQNAIEVLFEFDETWQGYTITAQLTKLQSTYNLLLDADNKVLVPSDITEGLWYVSVFGVKGSITRNTTISACINVVRGGYVTSGTPPVPPTPDLYQQLISQVKASEAAAAQSWQDVNVASTAAISNIETYGDTKYANALVGNKSGTLVNIDDAWRVKALKAGVDGKSEQVVTAGKNYFSFPVGYTKTASGVTLKVESDGILLTGTPTITSSFIRFVSPENSLAFVSGNSYTMQFPENRAGIEVWVASGAIGGTLNYSIADTSTASKTKVAGSDLAASTCDIKISFDVGTLNLKIHPQLEIGSTATEYEPYTGGVPSPSPESPQEVDIIDSPVSVQVVGKNLNKLPYESINKVSNGITWTLNNDGSVTANGTATDFSGFYFRWNEPLRLRGARTVGSGCSAGGSANSYCIIFDTGDSATRVYDTGAGVAIPDGWESVRFLARIYTGTTVSNLTFKPQIEVGTSPTPYEPYTSNEQTITLPPDHNYLASLPEGTHDELVLRADGVAVLTERVGKVVFDGSADEMWKDLGTSVSFRWRITVAGAIFATSTAKTFICDSYKTLPWASTPEPYGASSSADYGGVDILAIRNVDVATLVDWTARLVANPVTVYYKLETPATSYSADNGTTWSTTDPAAGNSAIQLYKGTNNVWCTDALSPNANLEYVQDTNAVIKKLSAAIVAAGATGV